MCLNHVSIRESEPPHGKTNIGENKGADQLRSNCEADQRLCFRYSDSTIPLLPKSEIFKILALFCACTGQFVSDLFGNHIVGFPTRRRVTPWALHNGADWQDYGAKKKIRWGYKKNMNGANLPVFFHRSMGLILQVSLYFLADKKILSTFNVLLKI